MLQTKRTRFKLPNRNPAQYIFGGSNWLRMRL